jgi:hypothetical protein
MTMFLHDPLIPMPTDQPQQPGLLDSISSGGQSRNLLREWGILK